jgi:hypothetical protein
MEYDVEGSGESDVDLREGGGEYTRHNVRHIRIELALPARKVLRGKYNKAVKNKQ